MLSYRHNSQENLLAGRQEGYATIARLHLSRLDLDAWEDLIDPRYLTTNTGARLKVFFDRVAYEDYKSRRPSGYRVVVKVSERTNELYAVIRLQHTGARVNRIE
jgi:hypothetical protein